MKDASLMDYVLILGGPCIGVTFIAVFSWMVGRRRK